MAEAISPSQVVIRGQPINVEEASTKELLGEIIHLLTDIFEKLDDI